MSFERGDIDVVPVVAIAKDRVIGVNNALPWRIPEDMRRFRTMTTGHPVIMGRKTFESIGQPLTNRTNIVVTRRPHLDGAQGIDIVNSLDEALERAAGVGQRAFVIGGAEIYQASLPFATRIEATLIYHDFPGDTFFPTLPPEWHVAAKEDGTSVQTAIPTLPLHYSFVSLTHGNHQDNCALCARPLKAGVMSPHEAGFVSLLGSIMPGLATLHA